MSVNFGIRNRNFLFFFPFGDEKRNGIFESLEFPLEKFILFGKTKISNRRAKVTTRNSLEFLHFFERCRKRNPSWGLATPPPPLVYRRTGDGPTRGTRFETPGKGVVGFRANTGSLQSETEKFLQVSDTLNASRATKGVPNSAKASFTTMAN